MSAEKYRRQTMLRDTVGDTPAIASMFRYDPVHDPVSKPQFAKGQGGRASNAKNGKLNLRGVAEVLESYGLDPIEELAKALTTEVPAQARDGTVILGPDGKPVMEPLIGLDVRVKVLTELAQYTRPKLKSIEVVNKGPALTDEQIDRRLEALMARAKDVTK